MGSHARPDNKTTSADHQLAGQGTQGIEQSQEPILINTTTKLARNIFFLGYSK